MDEVEEALPDRLEGTLITFTYDDGTAFNVPVSSSVMAVRERISDFMGGSGDEDYDEYSSNYLHLKVAGEKKETWIRMYDVRAIDIEALVLADLNTEVDS